MIYLSLCTLKSSLQRDHFGTFSCWFGSTQTQAYTFKIIILLIFCLIKINTFRISGSKLLRWWKEKSKPLCPGCDLYTALGVGVIDSVMLHERLSSQMAPNGATWEQWGLSFKPNCPFTPTLDWKTKPCILLSFYSVSFLGSLLPEPSGSCFLVFWGELSKCICFFKIR